MKRTVPVKHSNRKARDERLQSFDALADFANLGDEPEDWDDFAAKCPGFFPAEMEEWIYDNAKVWRAISDLPPSRPDNYQQLLDGPIKGWAPTEKEWALVRKDVAATLPPLLFYRNLLRRVWRREETYGDCLGALLGFDDASAVVFEKPMQLKEGGETWGSLFAWKAPEGPQEHEIGPAKYIDQKVATGYYLPMGTPWVEGKTSTINWEFGCRIQTEIYQLMQEPWRAVTCPVCREHFIRAKTAQKYCSSQCYGASKSKKALDYYHLTGKAKRQSLKALLASGKRKP
jgi:hypothetical protein